MEVITTDVLVVGGGTGGVAAALQAARRGAKTVLASEFSWLGGMLTAAGVAAPDGNELLAWQTGIWGAFLRSLQQRHPQGLDHAWVSFFTYEPQIGAAIFADWVQALSNLLWLPERYPLEVKKQGNAITAVRFADCLVPTRERPST
ncbi:FAD-dependent oxidoreductase [Leptolyngbya sp. 7M]|nr:FAD-dependent oxidoreductase [Leptolyngbya sp. 7M]